MKSWLVLVVLFVTLVAGAYMLQNSSSGATSQYTYKTPATIGKTPILIDQVDTPQRRERGLSNELSLKTNQGLLFIFDINDAHGIWMKDMNFAIDVVWLDQNFKIVSIRERFDPASYPEVAYPSGPAQYVLELSSGFVDLHQIKIGDSLSLE